MERNILMILTGQEEKNVWINKSQTKHACIYFPLWYRTASV